MKRMGVPQQRTTGLSVALRVWGGLFEEGAIRQRHEGARVGQAEGVQKHSQ